MWCFLYGTRVGVRRTRDLIGDLMKGPVRQRRIAVKIRIAVKAADPHGGGGGDP